MSLMGTPPSDGFEKKTSLRLINPAMTYSYGFLSYGYPWLFRFALRALWTAFNTVSSLSGLIR